MTYASDSMGRQEDSMQGLSYFIETFGCQMNERDSLRMGHQLSKAGCLQASTPSEADILILNTCSIRRKAEEKVYSLLGRLRSLKKKRPGLILAVGGCVAQQEGVRLLERMPHVDFVFGPHHVNEVQRLLEQCRKQKQRFVEISHARNTVKDLECSGVPDPGGLKAYVTVMEGCNNFCSYCVVPYVRGRERSRPPQSLHNEVCRLVDRGIKEITLLGQNVNAYRAPDQKGFGFPDLLAALSRVTGLRRLRFTTSHPKDLSRDLIQCFGENKILCEHIHLPLQSGSNRILSAMSRGYDIEHYLDRISALRERIPELAVTSDMIVGFPTEQEEDFLNTLDVMRGVRFDSLFSFKFSPRPGTRAARLEDGVLEEEKARRLKTLQELQRRIGLEINRNLEGQSLEVFVEGESRSGGQWSGRTRTNKVVNFEGPEGMLGTFVRVKIRNGFQNSLLGKQTSGTDASNASPADEHSSLTARKGTM